MSLAKVALAGSERQALREAAEWHALFCSDEVLATDKAAWQRWHDAEAAHRWAWQQLEFLQQRFQQVPAQLGADTLNIAARESAQQSRRAVLKNIALLLAGGGTLAITGWRAAPWQEWTAEYRTSIGEQRTLRLADGSRLILNTDTAVDVIYTDSQRLLRLHAGEILIETAKDTAISPRPYWVETTAGRMQALGTRFLVRQQENGRSRIAVLESAVAVQPAHLSPPALILKAGQQTDFSADHIASPAAVDDIVAAWTQGVLIATDWRLEDFLAELGRYRPGWLSCDPAVADFRVSGAFPLRDTDAALAALEQSFPVQLRYRSRYWVRVEARS